MGERTVGIGAVGTLRGGMGTLVGSASGVIYDLKILVSVLRAVSSLSPIVENRASRKDL